MKESEIIAIPWKRTPYLPLFSCYIIWQCRYIHAPGDPAEQSGSDTGLCGTAKKASFRGTNIIRYPVVPCTVSFRLQSGLGPSGG